MKRHPEEIRFAYYCGARGVLDSMIEAHRKGLNFKESIGRIALWLDNALLPWGRDDVYGISGVKYYEGFPLPPDIDRLPEIDRGRK